MEMYLHDIHIENVSSKMLFWNQQMSKSDFRTELSEANGEYYHNFGQSILSFNC